MPPTARRPPAPPIRQTSKVGMTELGSRAVAEAQAPNPGQGNNQPQITTYFTKAPVQGEPTPILYAGDRLWTLLTLTLETAGPVVVGNMSGLSPITGGKGQRLITNVPLQFKVPKGTRIYILASGANRVKFTTESLPWMEQITGLLGQLVQGVTGKVFGK